VDDGARGCFVAPFTHDAKPLGHPDHDPLFAACQDLDVPFAIHPTFEPQWTKGTRMGPWEYVRQLTLLPLITASDGVRHQFATLFDFALFDRFPRLKVLVLESGGSWAPYFFDRMDAVFAHTPVGNRVRLERLPSEYLADRVWISCDPDEKSIPHLIERFGDRFLWASDFPHPDHTPGYILDLEANVKPLSETSRAAFLGGNATELFKLDG
jgi:predicted TIM-barrel fold metal-dependent hydrolase